MAWSMITMGLLILSATLKAGSAAQIFNSDTGKSTGSTVSVIKVNAAPTLCKTPGVVASFAGLLRNIGYAGVLPYPQALESGI